EREHNIAESLQASLMGTVPERIDGLEFECLYRAALDEARVGGDFFDVFELPSDRIGIAIGDVSGKGLKAATQVAVAKYSLRAWAHECSSAACMMERVNKVIARDSESDSFTSIFAAVMDVKTGELDYANAGHAPV